MNNSREDAHGLVDGLHGDAWAERMPTTVDTPHGVVKESHWGAVFHEAEAQHHAAEALRHKESAIGFDPSTDGRGHRHGALLATSGSHWAKMFALRARAIFHRAEAARSQPR